MGIVKHIKLIADAREVVRAVCVSVLAMAVAACAMAMDGRYVITVALGIVIFVIAVETILHVRHAVGHLRSQSRLARQAAAEAERHYVEVLWRIVKFVEARDKYWRGHSENVGRLSEQIARRMGVNQRKCALLKLAGQLHDIGMIAVPERLLRSHAIFSADDYRSVKPHSEVSYEVLKPLELLADVLPAIRHHHERMNGTGYPDGLAGDSISLSARILMVADAYDAMTHDRPHRAAMTPLQAMRELRRCTPAGYDPACVAALAEVVNLPTLETVFTGQEQMADCAR
ncbi:MAG: HD-GYP domain-containing protein [Phycisphaerae bacterium]|nr:HD-GYP domain-containing protein [Phycisphaerae bacterium]